MYQVDDLSFDCRIWFSVESVLHNGARVVVIKVHIGSLLLLMVSSSLYVSHMFVTRVLSSLVFRVVLL